MRTGPAGRGRPRRRSPQAPQARQHHQPARPHPRRLVARHHMRARHRARRGRPACGLTATLSGRDRKRTSPRAKRQPAPAHARRPPRHCPAVLLLPLVNRRQQSGLVAFERDIQRVGMAACPKCGAVCPDVDGPRHPYLVSSAACWAAFGALQADEIARFGYPPVHGLVVDAYAVSHGGDGSDRRDRQSVCIHLIAICAVLERGEPPSRRVALLQRLTARKSDWPLLSRPDGWPRLDHTHLARAADVDDYSRRAAEWARAVWSLWSSEHAHIRDLLDAHSH